MRKNFSQHVDRFAKSNRLAGLIRELGEAINDEDDPELLRRLGTSLRDIGGTAMNKMRDLKNDR